MEPIPAMLLAYSGELSTSDRTRALSEASLPRSRQGVAGWGLISDRHLSAKFCLKGRVGIEVAQQVGIVT